ncbi:MAG: sugar phosphate isomerase/epimerase [Acidobacteria bacterium]|nr:sugar phosphate isomerase/epimerase [Acidobacteriota bacterium]
MKLTTRRRFLSAPALAACATRLAAAQPSQIKLGVTTDEIDEDVATAARFLREFSLGYAEVRNIWGKYNTAQPLEKIHGAKAIFDEHKIRTSVLGTAFFKIPLPPDTPRGRAVLDNQFALLDGAMERAKILGTDKIRIFAFTYEKGETPDAASYDRIYELVGEAARRARVRGFRLALENVGGSYVSTGAEAAQLLKSLHNDNLGLTWDPNNAGASGEKAFPDGYRKLDPARIFHVHLRDYRRAPDGKYEWCAVGEGEMDNVGQIRSLLRAGYKEAFTLETHWKSPQGKEHASRTSLTALLKVIAEV